MLVFKRIVDTDFADINFLREERPLDDGFLIPSQRHGDILEGIYLVTFSVGDENAPACPEGEVSIVRVCTNWFGVCVSTL